MVVRHHDDEQARRHARYFASVRAKPLTTFVTSTTRVRHDGRGVAAAALPRRFRTSTRAAQRQRHAGAIGGEVDRLGKDGRASLASGTTSRRAARRRRRATPHRIVFHPACDVRRSRHDIPPPGVRTTANASGRDGDRSSSRSLRTRRRA
jgi:hypothetical protein